MLGGGFVRDDLVQLSQIQRCGIVLVIHAHDESGLGLSSFHGSIVVVAQNALDFEFSCPDAMGLIPVQFGLTYRTIAKFDRGCSFQLPPSAWAVELS